MQRTGILLVSFKIYCANWVEVIYFMSALNDFRFTSSKKEKVALLINRKQGKNYHMRPVKIRHTRFSVIVTIAVRAREVYISRGLPNEAPRHNVRERNQLTDYD